MRQWLFAFQKSLALVLTHILERRKRGSNGKEAALWLNVLDEDRDRFQNTVRRPKNLPYRAFTMEDMGSNSRSPSSGNKKEHVFNLDKESPSSNLMSKYSIDSAYGDSSDKSKIIAMSPAIPIMDLKDAHDETYKLASSYRDEDRKVTPMSSFLKSRTGGSADNIDDEPDDDSSQQSPDNHSNHSNDQDDE